MLGRMLSLIQEALLSSVQREIIDVEHEIYLTNGGKHIHGQEVIGDIMERLKTLKAERTEITLLVADLRKHIIRRE